jgi:hypothetical protein
MVLQQAFRIKDLSIIKVVLNNSDQIHWGCADFHACSDAVMAMCYRE